ncbi:MAG: ribonuclease Y [Lentisphaerae bacterium]|nr:ribonuclease Y [Lentisphaerota bacterium]
MEMSMPWWLALIFTVVAATLGFFERMMVGKYSVKSDERNASIVLEDARREGETIKKDAELQAKAQVIKVREEFEQEAVKRRGELTASEERLNLREENLDKKVNMLDKKQQTLEQKLTELEQRDANLKRTTEEYTKLVDAEREKLQRIAGMTLKEARQALLSKVEEEMRGETGMLMRRLQEEAKETPERDARMVFAQAIQRYSSGHVCEVMTSTVDLPNDDMKGRIIGRDGRNIRALEAATGVDLLVDDTPEAVVVSAYDPLRREIARQTLERLIVDGRIHPARIEELVEKVREEINESIRTAGEDALYAAGIHGVSPELVRTLGRLKFRTSYSQNVLMHSLEVAQLMGVMAGEMGLDPAIAKRIGVFHDIGKALDSEVEGSHAIIGADFLRRHSEPQVVLNAVAAHHNDVEPEGPYAVLAAAADAISAARPGARSESTSIYVKRLEQLEAIATSFPGVEKSYAIQAGREVRILVEPEKIDDSAAMHMARDICNKIQQELEYPGQIKVVVIREKRCVEYAK